MSADRSNNYNEPWDRDEYRTGSVEPPRKRRLLVTVLLTCAVMLMGVVAILGAMGLKLTFQGKEPDGLPLSLQPADEQEGFAGVTIGSQPDTTIELQDPPGTVDNVPQEGGLSLQQIYDQCIDSVVSIICQSGGSSSSGTGVVLTQDGYIVTNHHVVEGADRIAVHFNDSTRLQAALVGTDETSDLAVLYVDGEGLVPAQFGNSDELRVGDAVVAIGDPLGVELRGTMTDGIVSAINRDIVTGGRTMTLIQTNAALNPGNSGGPLINCYGQVIGINTMKIGDDVSTTGVEGLGFAIPSTTVKTIVDQLIAQGYVSGRPHLGIQGEPVSGLAQYIYDLPSGLFITAVEDGSDAQSKGLTEGDILISLDGKQILDQSDLSAQLYNYQVGDQVEVVIYRSGLRYTLLLTVEESKG